MTLDPRTPVLIGSGQFLQRDASVDDALDPTALMAEAVRLAAADAGLSGVPAVDSIRVVRLLSWRHGDPGFLVAEQLGLSPRETAVTAVGGNSPQSLVSSTSLAILRGELDIAVLAGAEAWRTRQQARRTGATLTWPKAPPERLPRSLGDDVEMNAPEETERGIVAPVQVYPMFESAIRAAAGESVDDHLVKVSELWSRFSQVAAKNPNAWSRAPMSAVEIRTPSPGNRMIGLPYTKVMNSNNDVDMAAALILCSAERAASLGVSRDRWVFPHSGSDCHEHDFVSARWSFADTPAIALGGRRALELAGASISDVAVVDLYSCFPSAVQLGARSLGLALDGQLTRTGGLSFAGGPWNNYVTHAIATVIDDLRQRPGELGLVWGNGGYATKHAFGVYSTEPPAQPFRHAYPQDEIDAMPRRALASPEEAKGPATIEAYTVMHSRGGDPETAIAACLLADGRRAWGTSGEPDTAKAMCDGEWVARPVTLAADGTLQV